MRWVLALGAAAVLIAAGGGGCGGSRGREVAALPVDHKAPAEDPPAKLTDLHGDVVSVEVIGLAGARAAQAKTAIASKVGATFDPALASSDLHTLWGLGAVDDVRVEARAADRGVALRFVVRESPIVRSVDLRGSHAIPATRWLENIPVREGAVFSQAVMTRVVANIRGELQSFGHFTAKVDWSKTVAPDGRVDVVISLEEGPSVAVAAIDLRGNKAVKREVLLDILAKNGGTSVGARYWRDAVQNGLLHVSEYYYDRGYANLTVASPQEALSPDGSKITITIVIEEGPQFRIGKLDAKGDLLAPASTYTKLLGARTGEVFNRSAISKGLDKIQAMHREKGRTSDEIVPLTELDVEKKRIHLTVSVETRK